MTETCQEITPTERGYWTPGGDWIDTTGPSATRPTPSGFLWEHFYADGFERVVTRRKSKLERRGFADAEENMPPTGQAALWHQDVIQYVPISAQHVARQVARLCGDDSVVSVSQRSLADAVGKRNKVGNLRSYAERGTKALVESGWLHVETVGRGRGATTTYYLMPGDRDDWTFLIDQGDPLVEDVG